MKRMMFLASTAVLLYTLLCKGASVVDIVRAEAGKAIRWEAFWEGAEALGANYRPGSIVDLRVIRARGRLYAILGPIQMVVNIAIDPADDRVQTVRIIRSPGTSNAEVAESFLRVEEQMGSGCISAGTDAPNPKVDSTIPIGRPCPPPPAGVLSEDTISYTLPALDAPEAIQRKTVPADKDDLLAMVRRYLDSRRQVCGPQIAKIPFYADTDPRVYVFLSQASDCPRGVVSFSRAQNGRWEFGKFIADVPKEQLSGVIAKIESNAAMTLP